MKEEIKKIAKALSDYNIGLWRKKEYYKPFLNIIQPKNQLEEGSIIWGIVLLDMFYITQAIRYGFLEGDYEKLIIEYYRCIWERFKKKFILKKEMVDKEAFIKIIESLHLRYHTILLQHENDKPSPNWYVCDDLFQELSKERNLDAERKLKLQLYLFAHASLELKNASDLLGNIINIFKEE